MKGLDWFKVMSNIAVDDDLEHVSDAAFRTFIELVAISSMDLSDGRVCLLRAQKLCNTRRVVSTLAVLSASGHVQIVGDDIIIPNYTKYQQTREEVEAERAKNLDRVTAYRSRYKSVSNGVSTPYKSRVEKSREHIEKEEVKEERDALLSFALGAVAPSESTKTEYRGVINKHRARLNDQHIERVISELGAWTPPKPRRKLHLTLNAWLLKETPDPMPRGFVPPIEEGEELVTPEQVRETRQRLDQMTAAIGGRIE